MSSFAINFDWEDPGAARGEDLRATWARLQIDADNQTVTRIHDESVNAIRDGIYLPLLPVAEWIAENWWSLLHELHSPKPAPMYEQRHSLLSAREGFAVPPLEFHSHGDRIELTWNQLSSTHERVEFLSAGSTYLDKAEVEAQFRRLVDAVVSRLEEKGIQDSWLIEEWRAINEQGEEELEYCRAVAALGLHPFEIDETVREKITRLSKGVPPGLFYDICTISNENNYEKHVDWLGEVSGRLRDAGSEFLKLRDLHEGTKGHVYTESRQPWDQGYELAQRLRKELDLETNRFQGMDDLLHVFAGPSASERDTEGLSFPQSPSSSINAYMSVDNQYLPRFAVSERRENSRKFSFCRALGQYFSLGPDTAALVTESHSTTQQRNRAFAAEFLAPSQLLREEISDDFVEPDEIENLADSFGVSGYVIQHQLENHEITKVVR